MALHLPGGSPLNRLLAGWQRARDHLRGWRNARQWRRNHEIVGQADTYAGPDLGTAAWTPGLWLRLKQGLLGVAFFVALACAGFLAVVLLLGLVLAGTLRRLLGLPVPGSRRA